MLRACRTADREATRTREGEPPRDRHRRSGGPGGRRPAGPGGGAGSVEVQAQVEVAAAVAVRRGAEAEAAVEPQRRVVALVRVELDPPAAAGPGAVERRLEERAAEAGAAGGLVDVEVLE